MVAGPLTDLETGEKRTIESQGYVSRKVGLNVSRKVGFNVPRKVGFYVSRKVGFNLERLDLIPD